MAVAGDRSFVAVAKGYCLATHDTPLHGQQVEPDKLVWAIWPQASASAPWPASLRSIPILFGAGEARGQRLGCLLLLLPL